MPPSFTVAAAEQIASAHKRKFVFCYTKEDNNIRVSHDFNYLAMFSHLRLFGAALAAIAIDL